MVRTLFVVIFAGASAVGKTMGLTGVVQAILTALAPNSLWGKLQAFQLSEGLRNQLARVLAGLEPLTSTHQVNLPATPPGEGELPPSVRDALAKLPANAEWAYFSWPDRDELFYTLVGQNVPDADTLRAELRDDPNRVIVLYLHRTLADSPEQNRHAYVDLAAQLQSVNPAVTLADAAAKAATLQYHTHPLLPAANPEQSIPLLTPADLTRLVADFGPVETATRLRVEPDGEGFRVTGGLAVQNDRALAALRAVADAFYNTPEQESYRKLFPLLAQYDGSRVVAVETHTELFRQSAPLAARHYDPFDRLFGDTERSVSQQVLAGFQKRDVKFDGKSLTREPLQLQVETGRRLYQAIRRRCDNPRQPAPLTETDHVGYGHLAREAVARAAGLLPVVLAVILGTEFVATATGLIERSQWSAPWQLSVALVVVVALAALLTWVRHQLGRPAWTLEPGPSGPLVRVRRIDGVTGEATPQFVRLRQTALGRLLGFASGTLNGNQVRWFAFPAVGRLLRALNRTNELPAVAWWKDVALGVMIAALLLLHLVNWVGTTPDGGVLGRVLALAAALFVVFSPFNFRRSSPQLQEVLQ